MMKLTIGAALLASATCTAIPAFAQEIAPAARKTYVLDPVILRAGAPKVASSVPQSVSVVSGTQLDDIEPDTIGQVLDTVPGVAGVGSGGFFGQGFNIRGFGSTGAAASESGIVQLIDGEEKYYESYRQGSLFVEPDFLRQVEVLRGPGSSTLYGSGALGGVIAMETIEAGDLIPEGATQGGKVIRLDRGDNLPDNSELKRLFEEDQADRRPPPGPARTNGTLPSPARSRAGRRPGDRRNGRGRTGTAG